MKKIVLTSGLIAGSILALTMAVSVILCYNSGNFEGSMLIGYASMLLAFSLIYVAIKNYRDKYNGGSVSFGKAFKIGLFISLIASTMYVLAWQIEYNFFFPDFGDKYADHMIKEFKATNPSAAELSAKQAELDSFRDYYKNPIINILITYLEVLPIGLVISLICALILKRKKAEPAYA